MKKVWLIANERSGSTHAGAIESIAARFGDGDIEIVGRTAFPEEPLPGCEKLAARGAEGVAVYAGDGTINAVAAALDMWDKPCLILPGGTMNMLARSLHGETAAEAIVEAAAAGEAVALPFVAHGERRAYVGVIAGPASAWAHAREAVRRRHYRSLPRAMRFAWKRSFSRAVRVDSPGHRGRHKAVSIFPRDDGLEVSTISTGGWADLGRLGWQWIAGDWREAPGVITSREQEIAVIGASRIDALLDGEPAKLRSPARFTLGRSKLAFLRTRKEPR